MGSLATLRIALALTAALVTGALTACTGSSDEVVVYGATSEEVIQEWVQQFEEDSGTTVNYFRVPSNQLHQRWSQETEAGQHTADVIISSLPSEMAAAADHGWLAEIAPDDADKYDESYTVPNRAYPLYLGLDVIGWNTKEVTDAESEQLRSGRMDELLDSRWDERIALADMRSGGTQLANYQQLVDVESDEYGWEYLEQLASLDPTIYDSATALVERIVAGERAVSFTLPETILAPQVLKGAPIEWVYRDNPSAGMFMIGVSANAPHSDKAAEFTNWALSLEGQESLVDVNQGVSAHEDWVDNRPITKEPWYEPFDGEVYVDWAFDAALLERAPEYYERFADTFGLSS